MTKYVLINDGEGFEVPTNEIYKIACCDCGLVHEVVFVVEGDKLGMAARRNNRATAQRRLVNHCIDKVLHDQGSSKAVRTTRGSALEKELKDVA